MVPAPLHPSLVAAAPRLVESVERLGQGKESQITSERCSKLNGRRDGPSIVEKKRETPSLLLRELGTDADS